MYAKLSCGHRRPAQHILALLLALACLVLFRDVQATPDIQQWETSNGARVYFAEAPELPMVDVRVVFDAGSARNDGKAGLAQLTSAVLPDGAGNLTADQIAERFENVGAQFGTDAGRDMATVSLRSLTDPKLLQPALETFALILTQPTFAQPDFERNRNQMLIAVRHGLQSPGYLADKAFFASLYGDHPYGSPPDGTEESLGTITREDVLRFYQRYYVGRNAVVAIVGDLDRKAAERLAEAVVGKLPAGAAAPPLPEVQDLAQAREVEVAHPSAQSHVQIGQIGMARHDPQYFALYVGNHILGGSGLVSRLNDEIRERRGLSYSVYSYFYPLQRKGPFLMGLQTSTEQTEEAVRLLKEQLQRYITEGPTAEELAEAKKNITGGFALRIDSNRKIVDYLSTIGFYRLPLDYLDRFIERIEAVTLEDVRDAFRRHLEPDRNLTVVVGRAAMQARGDEGGGAAAQTPHISGEARGPHDGALVDVAAFLQDVPMNRSGSRNQLRIIGGRWRSRKLVFPDMPGLRPTPDRVRETLFNWLQPVIPGARCLDLFAGSGALGFEAASRGAGEVVLVERERKVADRLRENARLLGADNVRVVHADALHHLDAAPAQPFDVVFLDPPFGHNVLAQVCRRLEARGWLRDQARIYMEAERELGVPEVPANWTLVRSKAASQVGYHLAVRGAEAMQGVE